VFSVYLNRRLRASTNASVKTLSTKCDVTRQWGFLIWHSRRYDSSNKWVTILNLDDEDDRRQCIPSCTADVYSTDSLSSGLNENGFRSLSVRLQPEFKRLGFRLWSVVGSGFYSVKINRFFFSRGVSNCRWFNVYLKLSTAESYRSTLFLVVEKSYVK
jgi:hypothetical protein